MASFRWPSRELSDRSERTAELAAQQGLARLRDRARKLRSRPAPAPRPAPPRGPAVQVSAETPEQGDPPARAEAPRDPWGELDTLTEDLVAELRRDLGPEGSG